MARSARAFPALTSGDADVVVRGQQGTERLPDQQADVFFLRYLDVCLVLTTAPFVLVAGLPTLGYLVGAAAWILTRLATELAHARARRVGDAKVRAGLHVGAMMGRIWLVALALVLARYEGGKNDGIMAAALVLGAFTVYFLMSFVTREGPLQGSAHPQGRPSTS